MNISYTPEIYFPRVITLFIVIHLITKLFPFPGITVEDVKKCLGYHLNANIAYEDLHATVNIGGGKCEKIHMKDKCKCILILNYIFHLRKDYANLFPFYNQYSYCW